MMEIGRHACLFQRGTPCGLVPARVHDRQKQQVGLDQAGAVQHDMLEVAPAPVGTDKQSSRAVVVAVEIVPEHQFLGNIRSGKADVGKRVGPGDYMCSTMKQHHVVRKPGRQTTVMCCRIS